MAEKPNAVETDLSLEEAMKVYEENRALFGKQLAKVRQQFKYNIKLTAERKEACAQEVTRIKAKLAEMEPFRHDAEGGPIYTSLQISVIIQTHAQRLMEAEHAINTHNLGVLDGLPALEQIDPDAPESNLVFRYPEKDARYLEARAWMDLHTVLLYANQHLEGIDTLLRIAGGPGAIVVQSPEEETRRAGLAEGVKQAMAGSRDMTILVGQLGVEFQEMMALIEWAKSSLASWKSLPGQAKVQVLTDEDWAKLNAKVTLLANLGEKCRPFPALAELFPVYEPAELPFAPVSWTDPDDLGRGTGRLSGGTGRLSGTGRLGANSSVPQAGTGRLPQQGSGKH